MPKFADPSQQVKVKESPNVHCLGTIEIDNKARESKSGSGYFMARLRVQPLEGQGLPASGNLLFMPNWLSSKFNPADEFGGLDPADVAIARNRRNAGKATEEDMAIANLAGQQSVFENNLYSPRGNSLAQQLLGDAYDKFMESQDNADPADFVAALAEVAKKANAGTTFIYEAEQATDREGQPMARFQLNQLWRLTRENFAAYANATANFNGRRLFNLKELQAGASKAKK